MEGVETDEEIKWTAQGLDIEAELWKPKGETEIEERLVDKLSLHLSQ